MNEGAGGVDQPFVLAPSIPQRVPPLSVNGLIGATCFEEKIFQNCE
jgi:hypothetical protein